MGKSSRGGQHLEAKTIELNRFNRAIEQDINRLLDEKRHNGEMDLGLFLLSFVVDDMVRKFMPQMTRSEKLIHDAQWHLGFFGLLNPSMYPERVDQARAIDFRLYMTSKTQLDVMQQFRKEQLATNPYKDLPE